MIGIKRVKRIAVAVKDLKASVENWQRLFGVRPFQVGEEPQDKYAWVAFEIGDTSGAGEMTIEFLSPLNDPKGETLIGKFIRERGEGLYMITLETAGTAEQVDLEFTKTGIKPSWGGRMKEWTGAEGMDKVGISRWTEHYVDPKDANGVLITLASVVYKAPDANQAKPGKTVQPK